MRCTSRSGKANRPLGWTAFFHLAVLVGVSSLAGASAPEAPDHGAVEKALDERLAQVEQLAAGQLVQARRHLAEGGVVASGTAKQAQRLSELLRSLERAISFHNLEQVGNLTERARTLKGRLYNLERAAATGLAPPLPAVVSAGRGAGGGVGGRVTAADSGLPLSDAILTLFDSSGFFDGSAISGASGFYSFGELEAGDYFLVAGVNEYLPELYDDLPCLGGAFSCDPTSGTAIVVVASGSTTGIDFALDLGGSIEGQVTDSVSGDPLFTEIQVFDASGSLVDFIFTDGPADYRVGGLETGTYFARTRDTAGGYAEELYDNLFCDPDCDPTTGTPIAVTAGAATSGINFALERTGGLSGTLTDSQTGAPVMFVRVEAWQGSSLVGSDFTSSDGGYTVSGLAAGIYTVSTDAGAYLDELYDDLPCPGGGGVGCDPSTGTPVQVLSDTITPGIDFALDSPPGGWISGTVRDAPTGVSIGLDGNITISDSGGSFVESISTSGDYTSRRLTPGTYFLQTSFFSGYEQELYSGFPCPAFCDPTAGTPVEVQDGVTTAGIDFTLDRRGSISGQVADAVTGLPIISGLAVLFNASGIQLATDLVDTSGVFTFGNRTPGTYYVGTRGSSGYLDQLYAALPCPGGPPAGCDPTTGTPLQVELNSSLTGVDFALVRARIFSDGFESGDLSAWSGSSPSP